MKFQIEVSRSHRPFVHGSEHLDVVDGIKLKPLWNTFLNQLQNNAEDFLRFFLLDEIKICQFLAGRFEGWHQTLVNLVGINDDQALPGLTEDLI